MLQIEEKLFLLVLIKRKGNLSPLAKLHPYSVIIEEIKEMIKLGLIDDKEGLSLTDDGEKELVTLKNRQKMLNRDWIQPYIQAKRDKIDENYIYLPPKIDNL